MTYKPLPIGIDIFEEIVKHNYYFVDKTLFIKELLDRKGGVNLFTRPRRFGKTLALSMLQYYFEDTGDEISNEQRKKLFTGLEIMKEAALCAEHMCGYPVIFLSLKSGKQPDLELALLMLKRQIANEYQRHASVLNSMAEHKERYDKIMNEKANHADYIDSIAYLSQLLFKAYGKKTIILIDEYDVPLENAYFSGFYDEMVGFIRSLLESACKTNPFLNFAVITGCLRVSKESIFTGFNSIEIAIAAAIIY